MALVRPEIEQVAGFVCIQWIFRYQQQVCEYNTLVFHDRGARRQLVFDPLRRLQQYIMRDSEMTLLERFLEQPLWPRCTEIRVLDGDPNRAVLPCVASFVSPRPLRVAVSSLLLVITAYRFGSRNLQAILDAIRSTFRDHPNLERASSRFMCRVWAWYARWVRTSSIPSGQMLLNPGRFLKQERERRTSRRRFALHRDEHEDDLVVGCCGVQFSSEKAARTCTRRPTTGFNLCEDHLKHALEDSPIWCA